MFSVSVPVVAFTLDYFNFDSVNGIRRIATFPQSPAGRNTLHNHFCAATAREAESDFIRLLARFLKFLHKNAH